MKVLTQLMRETDQVFQLQSHVPLIKALTKRLVHFAPHLERIGVKMWDAEGLAQNLISHAEVEVRFKDMHRIQKFLETHFTEV